MSGSTTQSSTLLFSLRCGDGVFSITGPPAPRAEVGKDIRLKTPVQANKDTEKVDPQKEVGASVKTEKATDAIDSRENVPQIKSEDKGAA